MSVLETAESLAAEILAAEAWFNGLDPSLKDRLSQPNHDWQQAHRAVELARMVLGGNARGDT